MARQTIAEALREEGVQQEAIRARQQMLLVLLRERFRPLAPEAEQMVETTRERARLEEWIRKFATAKSIADIGILPPD